MLPGKINLRIIEMGVIHDKRKLACVEKLGKIFQVCGDVHRNPALVLCDQASPAKWFF
jgi:hypothetical protein